MSVRKKRTVKSVRQRTCLLTVVQQSVRHRFSQTKVLGQDRIHFFHDVVRWRRSPRHRSDHVNLNTSTFDTFRVHHHHQLINSKLQSNYTVSQKIRATVFSTISLTFLERVLLLFCMYLCFYVSYCIVVVSM